MAFLPVLIQGWIGFPKLGVDGAAYANIASTVLWPTVFSVISIWAVEVPVAYSLLHLTSLGIRGILIGYPAAFAVCPTFQYLYYRLVWKKKRIARLGG